MAARIAETTPLTIDAKTSFLDLTPPPWAARGLAWALLAVFTLGGIAAVAISMPEKVTAQFTLTPVRGADPVKAIRGGVITELLVAEGQAVNQGDLLLTLRSDSAAQQTAEVQTIETQLAGSGDSYQNAKRKLESVVLTDEQEARKLESRVRHLDNLIAHKRQQLALTERMKDSYEKLFREGIASQAQLTAKLIEVSELASEVERLATEQSDTRAELEKLKLSGATKQTEFKEFERDLKEKTKTGEIRAEALKSGLSNIDGAQVRLTAPCSGVVLKLKVRDKGALVGEGETVAELACGGNQLVAELTVPESGVGKLKLDQGVKLKYDAFPYQRFGAKHGRLVWLSPAKGEGSTNFTARVELTEKEISVKGQSRKLNAGMTGTAEIVVGKRTLLSYVFEPIKQLRENLADVP
ncbi:MAG: HlyD family efflux transporter periplasmic adaptor subunit [Acidobacteriota bacterium]|nr:HlyD family efflux transporter periplasmic adaptor subunit [Acidobacteriota bacterium]